MVLDDDKVRARLAKLDAAWRLGDGPRLERAFSFSDFKAALAFTNQVGALAERMGHHPDILLRYGEVVLFLWTHDEGGLTERDFSWAETLDAQLVGDPPGS